jgi:large subunit ribosomal protein L22
MEVRAKLGGLRIAPRKVRLVTGLIRRKDVQSALNQLEHVSNRAALPVAKLVNSAIANATNNFRMVRSNLYIKEISVDEGTKLRRWQPKGFGRAGAIQKKTSHVNIVLGEHQVGLRATEQPKHEEVPVPQVPERKADEAQTEPERKKDAVQPQEKDKGKPAKKGITGLGRRLFRRKRI